MSRITFSRVFPVFVAVMILSIASIQTLVPPYPILPPPPPPPFVNGNPELLRHGFVHSHGTIVQTQGVPLPYRNSREMANFNVPIYYNASPSSVSVSKLVVVCVMAVGYFFAL